VTRIAITTSVLALAAAVAATLPAGALAAYPGVNGKIVFQSNRTGQLDIWIVNGDGTDPVNLTTSITEYSQSPSFSADGRRIVFAVGGKLATMNADGSNLNVTTITVSLIGGPIFTPDGERIVFEQQVGPGGPEDLMIVAADGSGTPQTLQTGQTPTSQESDPAFSFDGNRLAFSSNRGPDYDNYLASGTGSGAVNFSNRPSFNQGSDFSPDATKLIWVNSVGTTSILQVAPLSPVPAAATTIPATGLGPFSTPVFSPDGTRIAYSSTAQGGDNDVLTADLAGGNIVNVSDGAVSNVASDTSLSWAPLTDSARTLTLRYKKRTGRFNGELTATDPGCVGSAKVEILRKRKGSFRPVAEGETDAAGAFSIKLRDASGKFTATAPAQARVNVANCLVASSPTLKLN
jgi:TolB protein